SAVGVDGHTAVSGSFSYTYYVNVVVPFFGVIPVPIDGAPTAPGSYDVVAAFTSSDPNYTSASSALTSFTIGQANAQPSVTGYSIPYDGNAHTAAASATDINGNPLPASDFVLTATAHTSAGTYTDAWSFHDPSGNYQDASGTVSDSISAVSANPS